VPRTSRGGAGDRMRTANIPADLRERIDAIKATLAERFIEGGAGDAYRPLPDGTRELVPKQELQHPSAAWSFPQRPTIPPKRAPVPTAPSVRAPRKSEIAARKPKPRPAPKVAAEPDAPSARLSSTSSRRVAACRSRPLMPGCTRLCCRRRCTARWRRMKRCTGGCTSACWCAVAAPRSSRKPMCAADADERHWPMISTFERGYTRRTR
jgi:hypothetical protein